jgi:transposase-like protein
MGRGIDVARHDSWRRRLERFSSWSGTVAEFCRREGVTQGTLYLWRKRLPREGASSGAVGSVLAPEAVRPTSDAQRAASFVELSLTGRAAMVEIELPNGAVVRVPAEHEATLRVAIGAAGELGSSGRDIGLGEVRS